MKVGGYNIMKQLTSQGVVKSTCVLVNEDKILKWWWLWATQMNGGTHEYGDWEVVGGGQEKVFKPLLKWKARSKKEEEVLGCCEEQR
jgi:hypothetical protein